MPKNRAIYIGIIVLAAATLLRLGVELHRIAWVLPYVIAFGVVLVVGGFLYELWKLRRKKKEE